MHLEFCINLAHKYSVKVVSIMNSFTGAPASPYGFFCPVYRALLMKGLLPILYQLGNIIANGNAYIEIPNIITFYLVIRCKDPIKLVACMVNVQF